MTGPSRKTRSHCRDQLIYYMGEVANGSSSSLASLKKIVATEEFAGLLTLLSGVGTHGMIKLLESASRNCAAKKAEIAEKINARKRADAVSGRLEGAKRVKLHETSCTSDHANGTAYDETKGSKPFPSYSKEPSIQRSSEEIRIAGGLYDRNQHQQRVGLSSRDLMPKVEDEDDTTSDKVSPLHSGLSSYGDNDLRSRVQTRYEDSASESWGKGGNPTENPEKIEDEETRARKRSQLAPEDGGETTDIGIGHSSEILSARDRALHLEAWDMYNKEVGIIRQDANIIAPIEDHCYTFLGDGSDCRRGNPKKEMGELLGHIEPLDFLCTKNRLVKYLKNRQAKMGMQLETPATWTMSEPKQVLGALRTIKTICDDAHIHRAFGQMKLYLLVQQELESGHKPLPSGKGKQRLPGTIYLKELARREAGPVSEDEIEAKFREHQSEYQAGKRWLEVADWFGGPGIVLVFITAGISGFDQVDYMLLLTQICSIGIGPFHVAAGWKVFQRRCLKYISKSLYSIKGLVGALGTDCLENYCRYGHLPQKYINKVIEYEGIIPAEEIDEVGSEMDEVEEDTSGTEDNGTNDEENGAMISDNDEKSGSGEDASTDDEDVSEHEEDVVDSEEDAGMED